MSSYGRLSLNSSIKFLEKGHCNGTMLSTLINYANLTTCNIDTRLSENKADILGKLDGLRSMLDVLPAINTAIAGIQSSFNEFRQKFDEQNSQLVELGESHSLLINENEILKNNIIQLTAKLADVESIVQSNKCVNHSDNSAKHVSPREFTEQTASDSTLAPVQAFPNAGQQACNATSGPGLRSEESNNIIISDFIDCNSNMVDPHKVAFVALRAVHPELHEEDIISAKQLSKRERGVAPGPNKKTRSINESTSNNLETSDNSRRPALLVRLASPAIVQSILKAKSSFTRFSTADIDLSPLGDSVIKHAKQSPIFINEYLIQEKYRNFSQLKLVAKNLGFKFVWHRRGRFLVKRKEGDKTYTFSTAADLDAIAKSMRNGNNSRISNKQQ